MTLRPGMPCDGCGEDCRSSFCQLWQEWFLQGWAAMNRFYAWQKEDARGKKHFTYELPHMQESPCEGCHCESWCDTPCSRRLKWWDERMDIIRRRAGHGTDTKAKPVR